MEKVLSLLFSKQDKQYRAFQAPLIPNIDKNLMIGVRTPELKIIAKEIGDTSLGKSFIETSSHTYFEEN